MERVFIVDDHSLVRAGIRRILEEEPNLQVVGEAQSAEETMREVRRLVPDVVIAELNMPAMGGLEATRRLVRLYPDLKVLIVTAQIEEPFPSRVLREGAAGYISKSSTPEELLAAVGAVRAGRRYVSADVAREMANTIVPYAGRSPFEALSNRELQIVLMFVRGLKVSEISERLCLSPKTVSTYRYRIFDKLGVRGDVEITRLAMRYGILEAVRGVTPEDTKGNTKAKPPHHESASYPRRAG